MLSHKIVLTYSAEFKKASCLALVNRWRVAGVDLQLWQNILYANQPIECGNKVAALLFKRKQNILVSTYELHSPLFNLLSTYLQYKLLLLLDFVRVIPQLLYLSLLNL